jgi:hypothetical protein
MREAPALCNLPVVAFDANTRHGRLEGGARQYFE